LLLNFKLAESQSKVCKTSKAHTLEHSARNLHAQKYAINWGAFYDAHRLQQGSKKRGSEVGKKWGLKHQPQVPFPAKENEKERLRAPHKTTLILLHLPSAKPAVLVCVYVWVRV